MFGFGFFPLFPFSFLIPIFFFVMVARVIRRFSRGYQRDRYVDQDTPYTAFPSQGPRGDSRPTQGQIFKLAYRLKGRLTVSDLVVESGMELSEAERLMESMVDGTHVRMEVDDRGIVTYEFPEIMRRFEE
jgi:hypothetical protein